MNKLEQAQLVGALQSMFSMYPNGKTSKLTLEAYTRALSDLPLQLVAAAMTKMVQSSKFLPTVAEIREAAEGMRSLASGRRVPDAVEAWAEVQGLVKRGGQYVAWEYSCQEVKQAVREYGGQMALCELQADEVGTARAQFMRIYNTICQRRAELSASIKALEGAGVKVPDRIKALASGHDMNKAISGGQGKNTGKEITAKASLRAQPPAGAILRA